MPINKKHSVAQSPASRDSNWTRQSLNSAGLDTHGASKPLKRKADKACAACRARRVRCDVMQRYHTTADGAARCSNCTMDNMKCVIEERKRRGKRFNYCQTKAPAAAAPELPSPHGVTQSRRDVIVDYHDTTNPEAQRLSGTSTATNDLIENCLGRSDATRTIDRNLSNLFNKSDHHKQGLGQPSFDADCIYSLLISASMYGDRTRTRLELTPHSPLSQGKLPDYFKPLPLQMAAVDIDCLYAKDSLSIPAAPLRNAVLRSYLEFVHPDMPIVDIHELLQIISDGNGKSGRVSLLLFQAVMFAGTAFVNMAYLKTAGYSNRKEARKAFFQKAKVLYDFDCEIDRVSLVQSLLLMTYGYETPEDRKDAWHWMGVAVSLAYTAGLHRDPQNSSIRTNTKGLRKRIWWSCFVQDRLLALGMRRPTRVKAEDYDVPMLAEDDFKTQSLSTSITIIPEDCSVVRDVDTQQILARMCIARAKLCICVGHVLSTQYSVLIRHQGMQSQVHNTRYDVMLFPKKLGQSNEVNRCDTELSQWLVELPECCLYTNKMPSGKSGPALFVQRSLLHMVYFTAVSALHRPHVVPLASTSQDERRRQFQRSCLKKVREATREVTRISQDLHIRGLESCLPATGVTVLLPAIIMHFLEAKSWNVDARQAAVAGFCECMAVLEKLQEIYPFADSATQFIEAAIRKADVEELMGIARDKMRREGVQSPLTSDGAKGLREDSKAVPSFYDESGIRPGIQGSRISDTRISIGRPVEYSFQNVVSAVTTPDRGHTIADQKNDFYQSNGAMMTFPTQGTNFYQDSFWGFYTGSDK